jgi:hypothetical protein
MSHKTRQSDSLGILGYGFMHSIDITLNGSFEETESLHRSILSPSFSIVEQYQMISL